MSSPTWSRWDSEEDASVNHTLPTADGGFFEARFVQRVDRYFIVYVSSHSGCRHACRFCHLTATAQVMMAPAGLEDFQQQTQKVLETFTSRRDERPLPEHVHVNFMARGEALSNPTVLNDSATLFQALRRQIQGVIDVPVSFRVSTIMPHDFEGNLANVLSDPEAYPYYSLYSMDEQFRRRWLPKAMAPERAFEHLKQFQDETGREVVLHWALIRGENDQLSDADRVLEALERWNIRARFNVVRYNPYSPKQGEETSEDLIHAVFERLQAGMTVPGSRIVPRVGFDVKASCGMFIGERRSKAQG